MRRLRTEDGARGARPGRARRAQAGIPALTAEVESAARRAEHARGAPDRARRGAIAPARGGRGVAGVEGAGRGRVPSCRARRAARWSRWQRVRCCSRWHARWAKRGPATCRGTRSSRGRSGRSAPTNRIARGCGSRSGGCARLLRTLAGVSATQRGFALAPRRAREVVVLARPVEEQHAAVLAFLADGESWSSSALALALGASQRTRAAGARLACGGGQGAVVRPRAGAPLDDPAGAGIHDDLVTPRAAAE